MKKNSLSIAFCAMFYLPHTAATTPPTLLTERPEVKAFIHNMAQKHHCDPNQLQGWLNQATVQPGILQTIAKPAESLTWGKYESIFLTPTRIQDGVLFWQQHSASLKKAEAMFGVPPEIIVAIIGVETSYGKQLRPHKVLDALVTLGFDYPPRSKFFLSELEEFLLLTREEKWDPTEVKGSYAGAMGIPQFIASSYRRYAIDFNGNGKRDLFNIDDSIGSVAHYFKENGWKKNEPVIFRANIQGNRFLPLVASKMAPKPTHSLKQLQQHGVKLDPRVKLSTELKNNPFALIVLEGKKGPEYWLGSQNFYVITRYNHSDNYAMAVYNLSQQIKHQYQATL